MNRMFTPQPGKPAWTIVNNTVSGSGIDDELEEIFHRLDPVKRKILAQRYATFVCHLNETARILEMAEGGGEL